LVFDIVNQPKTIHFLENGRCSIIFKSFEQKAYSSEELNKFIGKYFSEELDVVYDLRLEAEKLTLFIKDKKISELTDIMPDLFDIAKWGTSVKFSYNDQNKVDGLKLSHDRAQNIGFEKLS